MLNHLITSYRFLRKSTTYTLINLSGLILGLSAAFVLLIITINQLTYNRTIPNNEKIYRVLSVDGKRHITEGVSPLALNELFRKNIPCIEKTGIAVRFASIFSVSISKTDLFIDEPGMICANPALLDILGIQCTGSNIRHVLNDSMKIIISQHLATRYFGSGTAVGKTLRLKINGIIYPVQVEAIFRDIPWNSTFTADLIGSLSLFRILLKASDIDPEESFSSLENNFSETYIRLKPGSDYKDLLRQSITINRTSEAQALKTSYSFQPVSDVFLNSSHIQNDLVRKGKKEDIYVYISLAFFILFLAGVNYSILSTARSALRFREIGVRKVMGATKLNLRTQILTESILLTFIAFPLSFILLGLVLPQLERYFGPEISMYPENLWLYLPLFFLITLAIGIFSGAYVAFFLSAMDPLEALKSKFFSYKKFSLSKIFIVFQLFITLALMIGLINVYRQIDFCLTQNESSRKENLLILKFNPDEFKKYQELKNEILKNPEISMVSGASISPLETATILRKLQLPGERNRTGDFEIFYTDYGFFQTLKIPIIQGHELSKGEKTNGTQIAYINEEAEKIMKLNVVINSAIGKNRIKGVSANFNFHTVHSRIMPTIFILNPDACQTLIVRFKSTEQAEVLALVKLAWQKLAPDQPFDYRFYDHELAVIYKSEQNFGRIVGVFTLLAFIITGMGLFGLAMLLSERRMKEMAIRKIFGATNPEIIYQMQKEFIIYIGIAAVIAIPFTWYMMNLWLNEFYYRIDLHWFTFVLAVLAVAGFVSLILLVRTMKVIRENPIIALKYEG